MSRIEDGGAVEAGRDIWEVSNQLAGYVDERTPQDLCDFLTRKSKAAADLAAEITRLRAENAGMRDAAKVLDDHYERSVCHHDSTHRGGSIWTFCDDCGAQWADDEGGFRAFEYPAEVVSARAALSKASQAEGGEK